jgi:alpha-beta hydrolase superfamily lysophospholipase
MTTNIFLNICTGIITIIFITILLIKRFGYFPIGKSLELIDKYTEFTHGHLHGWVVDNPNSTSVILYCKDRIGDISHYQNKVISLRDMGYKVITFDYSGYGKSRGVPSEQQLYDDVSMITCFILQKYNPNQIILWGEGIGAPIATYAAVRYSIPILVLDSPLPSMNILARNKLGKAKILAFLFDEFNTILYLKVFTGKSLILHSIDNQTISYESIIKLRNISTNHIPLKENQDLPWENIKEFFK